jgi:hypothetical protein
MLDFGGINYYIDLEVLDKAITLKSGKVLETVTKTKKDNDGLTVTEIEELKRDTEEGKTIDAAKYDLLKYFIEILVESDEIDDDSMGNEMALDKATLGYKIIFNTLMNEGVLKEVEAD